MAARGQLVSVTPVTIFAHLIFIAVSTLVLVWLLHFREGVAFKSDNEEKNFNMHPLLMVIGFILVGGEAIVVYKAVPARRTQKVVHFLLHMIAMVAGILGLYAVFKFHNGSDMFTLHSWLGMITICSYVLQWVLAFFTYLFPGAELSTRGKLLPWHRFVGIVIFLLAICTAETGLVQRFLYLGLFRSQEALLVNFTGLLLFLYAVSISLVVILPRNY